MHKTQNNFYYFLAISACKFVIMSESATESGGVDIGHRLIAVMQGHTNGLPDSELVAQLPDLTTEQRVAAINKLLQQNLIEILSKGKTLLYRLKDPTKQNAVKGADNEEKIVYGIIEEGGNKGIWIRDIRFKSNLLMTQLNKILKSLENKKLIKAVKSVNVSSYYNKLIFQGLQLSF